MPSQLRTPMVTTTSRQRRSWWVAFCDYDWFPIAFVLSAAYGLVEFLVSMFSRFEAYIFNSSALGRFVNQYIDIAI